MPAAKPGTRKRSPVRKSARVASLAAELAASKDQVASLRVEAAAVLRHAAPTPVYELSEARGTSLAYAAPTVSQADFTTRERFLFLREVARRFFRSGNKLPASGFVGESSQLLDSLPEDHRWSAVNARGVQIPPGLLAVASG